MASKDKKAPERAEDEIEHERYEIPGDPGTGIRSITVERRGLQDYVQRTYENPHVTIAEAVLNAPPEAVDVMRQFRAKAEEIVIAAGGLPHERLDEIVEENWRDSGVQREAVELFVQAAHRDKIIKQFGHLSKENKAAQFIQDFEVVHKLAGSNDALWGAISRFCETAYWFQLDVTAVHFLAEQARRARGGRASSVQSRTQDTALKMKLLEVVLRDHLESATDARRLRNMTTLAGDIEARINSTLAAANLVPFKSDPLRKAVGKLMKVIRPSG